MHPTIGVDDTVVHVLAEAVYRVSEVLFGRHQSESGQEKDHRGLEKKKRRRSREKLSRPCKSVGKNWARRQKRRCGSHSAIFCSELRPCFHMQELLQSFPRHFMPRPYVTSKDKSDLIRPTLILQALQLSLKTQFDRRSPCYLVVEKAWATVYPHGIQLQHEPKLPDNAENVKVLRLQGQRCVDRWPSWISKTWMQLCMT